MNHVSSQGFRLVVPYLDTCRVRVKAAWVGRKIEQVRSSPRAALTVIEVMRMTSLVTFTSAPAILGGKKSCSALSAALTYGTVARLQLLRARQQEWIASETPGERAARLQLLRARQQV